MAYHLLSILLGISVLVSPVSAAELVNKKEITSLIGEVVIGNGSIKADQKARKELELIAKRLAKLPKQRMVEIEGSYPIKNLIEIEGVYPDDKIEEYFNKSFFLAMEAEGYIRDTLGVNQDYYLSARSRNELKATKPLIRIVLHTGTFEKQPVGSAEASTLPAKSVPLSAPVGQSVSVPQPQVTPIIPFGGVGQNLGDYQQIEPVPDSGPIDERLVAEQAIRAQSLIEQTKAKAAERDRKRMIEEKAAAERTNVEEPPQSK
jgi:hypothetical protein